MLKRAPLIAIGQSRSNRKPGFKTGMAAIEFALVLPVLLLIIVGSFDAAMATIFQSEVTYAADEIGLAATALAYNTPSLNDVTPASADTAMSIVYASVPALRAGLSSLSKYSVTMTGISFSAGSPVGCNDAAGACTVNANVAWVTQLDLGAAPTYVAPASSMTKMCDATFSPFTAVTPQTAQTTWTQFSTSVAHNIPTVISISNTNGVVTQTNMSGLGNSNVVVVDVTLTYTPFFLRFLTGPVVLSSTAYQVPRSSASTPMTYDVSSATFSTGVVNVATLDPNASPPAVVCSGYQ